MSEEYLVRFGSPTLAGIKTGNLFMCPVDSEKEAVKEITAYNKQLLCKGLCMIPMRFFDGKALIYMFRPKRLKKDLENPAARRILKKAGYECASYMECLQKLVKKVKQGGDFPHEIGLFLSYPPEDVSGFMDNHAANYKCVGSWKVYGNEEKARKTFALYDRCTKDYCRQVKLGKDLKYLAVAV